MGMNQWEGTHLSFPLLPPLPLAAPPVAPLPEAKNIGPRFGPGCLAHFRAPILNMWIHLAVGKLKAANRTGDHWV